jgi:hypothetical protein
MRSPSRHGQLTLRVSALALAACVSCDRAPSEPASRPASGLTSKGETRSAPSSPAGPRAARVALPPGNDTSFRFPGAKRMVAIGDVHGDLEATRAALRLAGAIDARDRWIGADLVVVQTGDQLDRGDDERRILDLFEKLMLEAKAAGGRFLPLNGNHEVMNVQGDFRYVTEAGFHEFAELAIGNPGGRGPESERGRFAAFAPGGVYAKLLAERPTVAVVGDTLFAHGGVLPKHVEYGLGRLNAEVSAWMRGERPELPRPMQSDDAPVWTRLYGERNPDAIACDALESALDALRVKRLVVGHTVQKSGINPACNERVFRIDIGLSRYYGTKPAQVLEIQGDTVKVLQEKRVESARVAAPQNVSAP